MATEPTTKGGESPLAVLYSDANLVLARAESLQGLQAAFNAEDEVVPTVLTARYRLRSGPVFGNLLAAFAVDMLRLRSEPNAERRGDLLPKPDPESRGRGSPTPSTGTARISSRRRFARSTRARSKRCSP